ncbi:MAG: XdhC family protein [Hyphomicrobiaceae bacterium]
MRKETAERIVADIAARRPAVLLTRLADGAEVYLSEAEAVRHPVHGAALSEAFRRDRSGILGEATEEVFANIFNPRLRMVLIGAVHIAQSLVPMALAAGYQVTIVDPRTAFATPERFPGVTLAPVWPDDVLPGLGLDRRTAFVALTHDPKIDDPALAVALTSEVFYVGALGSTRTHAKRRERLSAKGIDEAALDRIHAPIGLDIGAVGAPEIAISIMAEVTAVLRSKSGRPS